MEQDKKPQDVAKPVDFLRAVKAHLRGGKQKEAYQLMQQALLHYPESPLVLSYYGALQAIVDKRYRSGIEACKKAIALLKGGESFEMEVLFPVAYLNLGRAFVAAGKKKDAIEAFHKGLKYDGSNRDIQKELQSLGERKSPPLPFLDRSNPINKYIGMILHAGKKQPARKGTRQK
jgi:tetratricopeptide (TPR) repeat protein